MCLKTTQKTGCHFLSPPLYLVKHLLPSIPPRDDHSNLSGSAPPWPFLPWVAAADTPLVSDLLGLLPSKPFSILFKSDLSKVQNDHASLLLTTF